MGFKAFSQTGDRQQHILTDRRSPTLSEIPHRRLLTIFEITTEASLLRVRAFEVISVLKRLGFC
ncbi:hypothetical protein [Tolypothrix sp. NIES-4075]|uniref:hypothetical protein n=1 Tax=Tolypothrix sp. NIES-4075 TaxID=2005459 RepID=UPI00118049B4|nr:hypothetical protein [Tolypothrix sp. NIES-4075]